MWNYSRTPSRGVRELELYMDEQLVWKGLLQRAPPDGAARGDFSQLLAFGEEAGGAPGPAVAEWLERDAVLLVNEGRFVGCAAAGAAAAPAARPLTAAVLA